MKRKKVFKIGLLSLLIVALLMPTSVFVNASAVSESDEIVDIAIRYLTSDEDGVPVFNKKQAIEDGSVMKYWRLQIKRIK